MQLNLYSNLLGNGSLASTKKYVVKNAKRKMKIGMVILFGVSEFIKKMYSLFFAVSFSFRGNEILGHLYYTFLRSVFTI